MNHPLPLLRDDFHAIQLFKLCLCTVILCCPPLLDRNLAFFVPLDAPETIAFFMLTRIAVTFPPINMFPLQDAQSNFHNTVKTLEERYSAEIEDLQNQLQGAHKQLAVVNERFRDFQQQSFVSPRPATNPRNGVYSLGSRENVRASSTPRSPDNASTDRHHSEPSRDAISSALVEQQQELHHALNELWTTLETPAEEKVCAAAQMSIISATSTRMQISTCPIVLTSKS